MVHAADRPGADSAIPTELFGSIAQVKIVFPGSGLHALAKFLAIASVRWEFCRMSGQKHVRTRLLRLALGAYDLVQHIRAGCQTCLSYSRLLALGLATGVIASGSEPDGTACAGGGTRGRNCIYSLSFIGFGHLFNLAINLLGAYVHTCRLQYVEFFGKFYEGGGREFSPFKAKYEICRYQGGFIIYERYSFCIIRC